MALLTPLWLLVLLPLAAAMLVFRLPTTALRILRSILFVLVVLALARPAIRLPSKSGTVVVVADRSASMPHDAPKREEEMIRLVEGGVHGLNTLGIVAFGREAAVEQPPQQGRFGGFLNDVGNDGSSLAEGIERAIALIPRDGAGRIIVFSDGKFTGTDPLEAAARASARGIAIDYRALERPPARDLAISDVVVPREVAPRQSLFITAWVSASQRRSVSFELLRGSTRVASGTRMVEPGLNRFMFRDTAGAGGTLIYTLRVMGDDNDPVPENNVAKMLVGVRGDKPILCVSPTRNSGLAALLARGNVNVVACTPSDIRWSIEELSSYSAVILENIPSDAMHHRDMDALARWIEHAGTGLMLTGGRKSYGCGGWFRSKLERILPVSMELRQETRKFMLAIAVALDRSGSMSCPVSGGKVKMDLANLGTVEVLTMLTPQDEFGVLAVDSSPHIMLPFGPVANAGNARDRILRIRSEGGGIFIYEALKGASAMLSTATSANRHLILFADAADSEEPGDYVSLIASLRAANTTVSVIGLGTKADCDAKLLEDIAKRGGGDVYFSDDAHEIPRLFAQDMFTVSRSAFVETQTAVKATAGLATVARTVPAPLPSIGGYNLCYLKPGADLAAYSVDEYKSPIISSWRVGSGRALCYTGEADGNYAGPMAKWDSVGELFSSMARWTAGVQASLPDGSMVTHSVRNGRYRVELHLDPERTKDPLSGAPMVSLMRGGQGAATEPVPEPMRWQSADLLVYDAPLVGGETALATVSFSSNQVVALPPVCLPYSPEFAPDSGTRGVETLRRIAAMTGGIERNDLRAIWRDLPRKARWFDLAPWVMATALCVFLLEIFQRRTGLLSITRRTRVRLAESDATPSTGVVTKKKAAAESAAAASPAEPKPAKKDAQKKTEEKKEEESSTLDALRKARNRASKRTGDSG